MLDYAAARLIIPQEFAQIKFADDTLKHNFIVEFQRMENYKIPVNLPLDKFSRLTI
jgi:hypothetical protein